MATVSSTSLSGLGLSGLSSGLDTSGIITKLMAIESQPQTQLKSRLSDTTAYRSALQSLNTAVAGVASEAKSASATGTLASFTTSADTVGITAKAGSTASAGAVSFVVNQTAKAQVDVTDAIAGWPDASSTTPSITIRVGSGAGSTTTTVTAASGNLNDVVAAINGSATGVTASKVAAGTDASGTTLYRLQLRGQAGVANGFSIFEGSSTSATALPTTQISSAQDAQLTLFGGTAAQQTVTSASNTFTGLITGIDVTVTAPTTSEATITVTPDSTAATTAAQTLTSGLITLFSGIASSTAVSTTTGSDGKTATSGGVFTGDSAIRLLKDALLSAASDPVGGRSPSSIGIAITKDGTISFDQGKFTAAMQSDPSGTTSLFQTIAGRVSTAATAASDPYTGTITQKITSQQGAESDLTKQISDWDTRLAVIQAQYTTQFNNLETALNSLNSQASYLTSQIAGLTTNYQK